MWYVKLRRSTFRTTRLVLCKEHTVRNIAIRLNDYFFGKIHSTIMEAETQMREWDANDNAKYIVYINLHFDDFLGEYKENYLRQIDEYLSGHPFPRVNFAFHNDHTAFYKPLAMSNATVVNED